MPVSENARPKVRSAQLIGFAIAFSNVVLAGVLFGLHFAGIMPANGFVEMDASVASWLVPILFVVGLGFIGASFVMKSAMQRGAAGASMAPQQRVQTMIVVLALCDGAGMVGFVAALVTGNLVWPIVLMGLGFGACILHIPLREV